MGMIGDPMNYSAFLWTLVAIITGVWLGRKALQFLSHEKPSRPEADWAYGDEWKNADLNSGSEESVDWVDVVLRRGDEGYTNAGFMEMVHILSIHGIRSRYRPAFTGIESPAMQTNALQVPAVDAEKALTLLRENEKI